MSLDAIWVEAQQPATSEAQQLETTQTFFLKVQNEIGIMMLL